MFTFKLKQADGIPADPPSSRASAHAGTRPSGEQRGSKQRLELRRRCDLHATDDRIPFVAGVCQRPHTVQQRLLRKKEERHTVL
jgi:hypothetical protein